MTINLNQFIEYMALLFNAYYFTAHYGIMAGLTAGFTLATICNSNKKE